MAESVFEELQRKLNGCQNALKETRDLVKRYQAKADIPSRRESDLILALTPFKEPIPYDPHLHIAEYAPSVGENKCQ